ncbi:flagellar basal body rod protein FlgB [Alkalilimnicola sp. S0819]|uniref:flagellar basal body rod protein FlgB n=1 Tax=Alkalilimnicola sp. S0819 TaxID=2613922 RepID=UPI0012616AE0|nr:flagellar basal body rod protein FlgB [Alkalilimnicola sp. S0819]KAB7627201.1 flagellar basal body rod protein FlgB [Alkalilimnicola sp. S0819]MPQ15914.1 flagellar basal body rod protein FlgB [Alkalilimnicola sp. S0819]
MSISFDKTFGVHAAALKLRAERTKLLAENLANADTPNYKARDLDFQAALRQAQGGQGEMRATHARHIQPEGGGAFQPRALYRVPQQPSLDGNTVETQVEQAKFAENSVHYQASLNFLTGRIQGLLGALRGE